MKAGAGAARVDESPSRPDAKRVVASLRRMGSARGRAAMARYALPSEKAFGVSVASIQALAKRLGRSHELAEDLWNAEWFEARMLAAFVDEPGRVTAAQMDRWTRDFDNWGICDTVCICLFDRTPYGFGRVKVWATRRDEFVKRAAFALLAGLALHDKEAGDESFVRCLPLVEAASSDERNFVKKAVNWALRAIGRRNLTLHAEALAVARRLSDAADASPRWIGKGALRELTSPVVMRKLAGRPRLSR